MADRNRELADRLADHHLRPLSREVTDLVFTIAYEDAHSEGVEMVEQRYAELARIAGLAFEEGQRV